MVLNMLHGTGVLRFKIEHEFLGACYEDQKRNMYTANRLITKGWVYYYPFLPVDD